MSGGEYSFEYSPKYFLTTSTILYIMPKKILTLIKKIVYFALCISIIVLTPVLAILQSDNAKADKTPAMLNLWQIDSFEGGRGSRATFLQNIADDFAKKNNCFIKVTALSADAARMNLRSGNAPDLISYGSGTYGIEEFIHGKKPFYTWCHGGYCILTTEPNSSFSDVTAENTVINSGTDNFSGAAALLSGLQNATRDKPTGAYIKLINGDYKYLLGTQRDVFRLKTREVAFSIKPLTEFNDLYQNISICTDQPQKNSHAEKFIEFLLNNGDKINKIGLLSDGTKLYDDEMAQMEELSYTNKLVAPISESTKNEIDNAITNNDENKLKNLLK